MEREHTIVKNRIHFLEMNMNRHNLTSKLRKY